MVRYGIDVLCNTHDYHKLFKGKRVGLLTNQTGLDTQFRSTVDLIKERYDLTALFGPEHGVRGDKEPGAEIDTFIDKTTGIPVYSLYRKDSKRLSVEMLDTFDVLVYDIQDVGSRFYTYIYSMLYALQDCAKAGKSVVILDRPNPLGGNIVEGNILREGFRSFVGDYPMCMRYGLTIGELALMANEEENINADLSVIACEGLTRDMLWHDMKLHWVMPSPNLTRFEAALLYSGTCLFEGTNLSEGRGTALPLEIIGAPYIENPMALTEAMNSKNLPGVLFRDLYFTPDKQKNAGELCGGVQLHITDMRKIKPVKTAVELLYEIQKQYPISFEWRTVLPPATRPHIELLSGDNNLYTKQPILEVLSQYSEDEIAFAKCKAKFHLYK